MTPFKKSPAQHPATTWKRALFTSAAHSRYCRPRWIKCIRAPGLIVGRKTSLLAA
ncbi:hypothetical protein L873DRAFT_1810152 [Choiromyces venosus 120613-1]|uniref:Uncharacterized protein n=1 Tax=Choiromyces venosus 120613-1 TaxID=1336337 RepID=A0A3N4JFR5_9PEZI|nr:hypothetical protein L873DRAFT_1810152 [Choiromyces venosus 120613-1]